MKGEDDFREASQDRIRRREKIEPLRFHRTFTLDLLVFCATIPIAFSLLQGLTEGKWVAGTASIGPAILLGLWICTNNGTRMAA